MLACLTATPSSLPVFPQAATRRESHPPSTDTMPFTKAPPARRLPRLPFAAFFLLASVARASVAPSQCCHTTVGFTYDVCTQQSPCQFPRHCLRTHDHTPCDFSSSEKCHCVPIVMTPCLQATDCLAYPAEVCAYLPNSLSYCYSQHIVTSNSSFNYQVGSCCGGGHPSPSPVAPPVSSAPHPSSSPTSASHPSPSNSRPPRPSMSRQASPPPKETLSVSLVPVPSTIPSQQPKPSGETPSPSPSRETGLTGDTCDDTRPCKGFRKCDAPPCGSSSCAGQCVWSLVCTCTSDCENGEVCVSSTRDPNGVRSCYSPFRVQGLDWVRIHSCNDSGMTGDGCLTDANCRGGRECVQGGRSECLTGLQQCGLARPKCGEGNIPAYDCYCSGVRFCDCQNPCEDDAEVCCETQFGRNACISRKSVDHDITRLQCELTVNGTEYLPPVGEQQFAVNNPLQLGPDPLAANGASPPPATGPGSGTGTGGGNGDGSGGWGGGNGNDDLVQADTVCVDASLLERAGVPLVFAQHRRAAVLCDAQGSCATPGHIVRWNGHPMMMKTYCASTAVAPCSRTVMAVNSISYRRRGIAVDSNTNGLIFTALAARHETALEEAVLRSVVRLGF